MAFRDSSTSSVEPLASPGEAANAARRRNTHDDLTRELGPGDAPSIEHSARADSRDGAELPVSDKAEVDESDLTHGDFVGRYSVLSRLGQGGMGVVYKAYDPQLDRNVALKLLRRGRSTVEADLRLLREAQTLAKLRHPNVVAVHDAGLTNHGVFIAMELLEGRTLNDWLEQEPRSVSEILAAFRAAGRGLLAAHEAGFIHRDFKPSNINVGDDGEVKVLDFGLAHLVEDAEDGSDGATARRRIVERPHGASIAADSNSGTREYVASGGIPVMGTPAFMAPEQFLGGRIDQRSEQFAVAMSLYVALYDRSPLGGATLEERQETLETGLRLSESELERSANSERVPPRIRRVIMRGLATEPGERFESMQQMLAELEEPRRRWREAVAGLTLLIGFGVGAVVFDDEQARPCSEPSSALQGTWSADDQARVGSVFDRVASADEDSRQHVIEQLDGYATAWVQMYEESCQATFVAQRQSERMFDQRMRCLERRRNRLRSAIDSLAAAEDRAQLVKRTIAPFKLPALEPCADLDYVMAEQPPPEDEAERQQVAQLREKIDEAVTLYHVGDYGAGVSLAQEVLAEAEPLGHAPLLAETLENLGMLQLGARKIEQAQHALERAIRVGSAAKTDRSVAISWTHLLFAKSANNELDAAQALELPAWAAIDRADEAIIRAWLLNSLGYLAARQGDYERSLESLHQAQALKIESLGEDHVDVGISWFNLGTSLSKSGAYDEAREAFGRAQAIVDATVGRAHPLSHAVLRSLGLLELRANNAAAAIEPLEAARTDYEGAPPGWIARCSLMLARAQWLSGDPEAAKTTAAQAREEARDHAKAIADIERWEQDPEAFEDEERRGLRTPASSGAPKPKSEGGKSSADGSAVPEPAASGGAGSGR